MSQLEGQVRVDYGRVATLEPLPAFDAVRPALTAATGGEAVALRVLALPMNDVPAVDDLAPALATAVLDLARLHFELSDAAGLPVPAVVVRLADRGDPGRVPGVRVRVQFRYSFSTDPANIGPTPPVGRRGGAPGA